MFGVGDFFIGIIPLVMEIFRLMAEFFASSVPEWILRFTTLPIWLLSKFTDVLNIFMVYSLNIINALIDLLPDFITPQGLVVLSDFIEEFISMFFNNGGSIYFETIYEQMIVYAQAMPTMVYLFVFCLSMLIVLGTIVYTVIITKSICEVIFEIVDIIIGIINVLVPG